MQRILEICDVSKHYGEGESAVHALRHVSFSLEQGAFAGIMGSSGCGKSTLLNLIATLDTATEGSVCMDGQNLAALTEDGLAHIRQEHLGFIYQDYNLLDTLTLRENIALALTIQKRKSKEIDEAIEPIALRLGIAGVLNKFPCEVSGGQRQRCACARAVAAGPRLILADEPTGALDSTSARELMETFGQMNREMGVTILMVTHDAFSACYCERILFMRDGEIVNELAKEGEAPRAFLPRILGELARVSGGGEYVY